METHQFLQKYFKKKKKSQYGFSQRKLAQEIAISPAFLSNVLSGKKPIPYPLLMKLCRSLNIESEVTEKIKSAHHGFVGASAFQKKGKSRVKTQLAGWDIASRDQFLVLRQWFYIPILIFSQSKLFDGTPASVAKKLGISRPSVEIALRDLTAMGMYTEVDGKYFCTDKKIRWSSEKSLREIRLFHENMMKQAIAVLHSQTDQESFEKRLITGITVTTNPEKILAARLKLSECLHEIANDMMIENGSEVYHLAGQLFSLLK